MAEKTVQQHMPRRRTGHTTSVTISGQRFYLTANAGADGSLGEVFIQWGKQGTTAAGLMDIYAVALSIGLQHCVPLTELVSQGLNLCFVPNGHTDDPDLPQVRSVVDWVDRRLAIDWLPFHERAQLGIFTMDERVDQASDWMAREDVALSRSQVPAGTKQPGADVDLTAFWNDMASGIGVPAQPHR